MSAHPVSRLQWLSWGTAALAGTVAAYAVGALASSARSSCGAAVEAQHGVAYGSGWLLPTAAAAGLAVAAAVLARWATVRGPRSGRASGQVAVVLFVLTALGWWYVTGHTPPAGGTGPCPDGGVPPWWPGWFPS
ncbi:hypothetical protein ABZO31_25810 [Streptomyces sp. HUAS MG47]|uniref:hypothetical protein n=1 Tax=Streptomyces solicamelliae TaxID=3231716 RepID=UPI00387842E0